MTNGAGKPKPAFFVAVAAVVLGLVGLAFYRCNAKKSDDTQQTGKIDIKDIKKQAGGSNATNVESPDGTSITTTKDYTFEPSTRLPEVPGTGDYKKLVDVKDKIQKYDAELKMSEAEAEVAKLTQSFNMDITTDFGQLEDVIQRKIDTNRGKARVASDLSSEGIDKINAEERMEKSMADDALKDLEVELGMRAPETTPIVATAKDLGPAEIKREEPTKVTE